MARISIFLLLVVVWLGVTAGRFVLDEREIRIEDEDEITLSEGALFADPEVEVDAAVLKAILRGEISLEELLGEGLVQDLETKLVDGSLMDSSWTKCLSINTRILGIKVDTEICVTVEWLSTNMGLRVTIKVGKYTWSKEISVSNPPALCYGIPGIKFLKVCIQFYNINISNKSGCVRIKISVLSWNLGCFDFLHKGEGEHLSQLPKAVQLIAKTKTVEKPSSVMFLQD